MRQHNQIGDMLCSLTLYAALKKKHPYASITLVAAKTNYEIPFLDINPFIDRVLIFNKSSLKTILKFVKELRSRKYQVGVVPSTIVLSRTSHIISFVSGAKVRVGVKSIDGKVNESNKYLTVKNDFNWKEKHQAIRNLEVVNQIGCDLTEEEIKSIRFAFTEQELSFADNFINENFNDRSKKIIAFHPGAGKTANIWLAEKFIAVVKNLYSKYQNHILITSGWKDETVISNIVNELAKSEISSIVLHNCEIKKLGAILSKCDLYITNDTGTMHVAGYSDAKMISLFGPTDPSEWAPVGKNKIAIKSITNIIADISVDEVISAAEKILNS